MSTFEKIAKIALDHGHEAKVLKHCVWVKDCGGSTAFITNFKTLYVWLGY